MSLQESQQKLERMNVTTRRLLEEAELRIPPINEIISRVAAAGLARGAILLGDIMAELPYVDSRAAHDSGQVLQAVLAVPGGIGLVRWDSEEFAWRCKSPEPSDHDVEIRFISFTDLALGEKALLMLHAGSLLERLCAIVLPQASFGRPTQDGP